MALATAAYAQLLATYQQQVASALFTQYHEIFASTAAICGAGALTTLALHHRH